ncbi:MAG TPA: GNAT family N-acetyltransferase [Stellaceae bacterium]|nr:GNAT family N-acetyltransferase [Stellaceae bacterium]
MTIIYRPARPDDLTAAGAIVQQAYNDLRVRHGLAPTVGLRAPLFQRFCLAEDPDGLWVAEADDGIVGFGFSWICQKFWFLAQLFIRPGTQASGIGRTLLSKTLEQAQRNDAGNRALITLAYNPISTGLYVRNGMYPREPLYSVAAPASVVGQYVTTAAYDAVPIAPWPEPQRWIGEIDEQVLGFRRDSHHRFLLGEYPVRAIRIERAGRPVGYAYVSAEGHVGPLAIALDADRKAVVATAIQCALQQNPAQLSMIVAGRAEQILDTVSAFGFRLDEPYVLLSAQPFGDWRNYMPNNPGYM